MKTVTEKTWSNDLKYYNTPKVYAVYRGSEKSYYSHLNCIKNFRRIGNNPDVTKCKKGSKDGINTDGKSLVLI